MPVFMRAGCNTGSCHGAARGKDGFRLSLFGFDPRRRPLPPHARDRLRRINLALPAESLLIEKAIGSVPHTGGKRFDADSEYYQTLLRWLEAGVPQRRRPTCRTSSASSSIRPRRVLDGEGRDAAVHRPREVLPTAPTAT